MAGRKIRDAADAQACLAEAERSGLGRASWAHNNNIDGRSLNAWRMNLARRREQSVAGELSRPPLRLVELVVDEATTPARYVVRLGGVAIEVDDHFNDATLRRLLGVVTSC